MRIKRKNRKGSFLIEALLTVMIMSVSLVLIVQSLITSLTSAVRSAEHSKAALVMENKLFEIFNTPSSESETSGSGNFSQPFEKYRYDFSVVPFKEGSELEGLSTVDLKVSWTAKGKSKYLDLTTYHFNPVE